MAASLSPRAQRFAQARIALAVAAGATNREVAASLFLSPPSIEFHLGRVYRKLRIRSRTELAAIAAAGGLAVGAAPSEAAIEDRLARDAAPDITR